MPVHCHCVCVILIVSNIQLFLSSTHTHYDNLCSLLFGENGGQESTCTVLIQQMNWFTVGITQHDVIGDICTDSIRTDHVTLELCRRVGENYSASLLCVCHDLMNRRSAMQCGKLYNSWPLLLCICCISIPVL